MRVEHNYLRMWTGTWILLLRAQKRCGIVVRSPRYALVWFSLSFFPFPPPLVTMYRGQVLEPADYCTYLFLAYGAYPIV